MDTGDALGHYPASEEPDIKRRRVRLGRLALAGGLAVLAGAGFAVAWPIRGGAGPAGTDVAAPSVSPVAASSASPGPLTPVGRWTTADGIVVRVYKGTFVSGTDGTIGPSQCTPAAAITVEMSDASAVGEGDASIFSVPGQAARVAANGSWGEAEGDPVAWAVVASPPSVDQVTVSFAGGASATEQPTDGISVFASHVRRVVGDGRFATFTAHTSTGTPVPVDLGSGCVPPATAPPSQAPLPAPGIQPADPAAARAAIVKAFTEFYTAPPSEALSYVQGADQAVVNAGKQATANNPGVTEVGANVDQVVFTSPTTAAVRFDILVNGRAVLSGDTGGAVLDGGVWKLTRATACADFSLGGGHC